MIETVVVIEEGFEYTGGSGYEGPLLARLGFPKGPYTSKVANILKRQLERIAPERSFVTEQYRK